VKLTARRGRTAVATGSAKVKAGTATVKLRFTAKGKRTLRHAHTVTLKITGGGLSATVVLKRR
jgi:hypothetical protein